MAGSVQLVVPLSTVVPLASVKSSTQNGEGVFAALVTVTDWELVHPLAGLVTVKV